MKRALALIVITKHTYCHYQTRVLVLYQFPQTAIPVINSVLYFLSCFVVALPLVCINYRVYHLRNVPGSHKIESMFFFITVIIYFSNIFNIERAGKRREQKKL